MPLLQSLARAFMPCLAWRCWVVSIVGANENPADAGQAAAADDQVGAGEGQAGARFLDLDLGFEPLAGAGPAAEVGGQR